jgi:hypothetical protein
MSEFTEKDWKEVLSYLSEVIGADAERYAKVPAAKLTAAIPYLAGSEDPDRFAVSNLLTFHAATKARKLFDHRPADDEDVFRRLAAFHVGSKADPKVVDYGLSLLALISLSDHEHDADADQKAGKYNPLNARKWDAAAVRKELEDELAKHPAVAEVFSETIQPSALVAAW